LTAYLRDILVTFAANDFLAFFKAVGVIPKVQVWVDSGKFLIIWFAICKVKAYVALVNIRSRRHNSLSCIVAVPADRIYHSCDCLFALGVATFQRTICLLGSGV